MVPDEARIPAVIRRLRRQFVNLVQRDQPRGEEEVVLWTEKRDISRVLADDQPYLVVQYVEPKPRGSSVTAEIRPRSRVIPFTTRLLIWIALGVAIACALYLALRGITGTSQDPTVSFVTEFSPDSGTITSCCYEGWAGVAFSIGSAPVTVTELGRWVLPGNRRNHQLKIVEAATRNEVPGAAVNLPLVGRAPGQFYYAPLSRPVKLAANFRYYLVSSERAFNHEPEQFYAHDAAAVTTVIASLIKPVYWTNNSWLEIDSPNTAYGPLSFKYFPSE
jgi:hypothetical protein